MDGAIIIDDSPLPERDSLTAKIESLDVGQCLTAVDGSRAVLATLASRVQAANEGRRYRTADAPPRVWRLA